MKATHNKWDGEKEPARKMMVKKFGQLVPFSSSWVSLFLEVRVAVVCWLREALVGHAGDRTKTSADHRTARGPQTDHCRSSSWTEFPNMEVANSSGWLPS